MIEALQAGGETLWKFTVDTGSFVISQTVANFIAVVIGIMNGGTDAVEALFPLSVLILQLIAVLAVGKVLQMIWFLSHELHIWNRPKSYSAQREGGKKILVIGDSTAYGMGADTPEDTIAGRLGRDFPRTEIINTAINGSLTRDAINQLRQAGSEKFDLIIISTGGNDIWHFTRLKSLESDLKHLLEVAIEKSERRVILLFYADLGGAPIFPSAIRSVLGKRAQQVHEVFISVATALQVPLVELYTSKQVHKFSPNPFLEEPRKYYAKDRMHPNSEGYRLWYNRMWGEMVARDLKFKE